MGLFNFKEKKEKREQAERERQQLKKERDQSIFEDKLYFEAVRRDDKKRNFCFVPLISINRTDGQYNNGIHAPDITFEFIEINGHILPKYNFNQNIKLSLKPGKYKVRVFCKVNRNIGIEENAKRKEHDFRDKMSYNGYSEVLKEALFHEATINVNESDICYLLFKLTISAKFKVTSTVINGEVWTNRTLVDFKYGYGFYQTSEGVLRQMCDYCITSPVAYDYPPVDQTALQEYIKNHQHELPKSEQVAKAPAQKSMVETPAPKTTVSKPAAPASKPTTAKPAEQKTAVTPKTVAKAPAKPVVEKPVKKTINYPNGDKYVGYVLGDKKQGKGVLYYANGNKYEGDFANDLPHGKGSLLFNDVNDKKTKGHLYTGDFVCGKMHGFGVYAYPNGMRYEGGFANDVRDGKGKMYENQKFLFDTLYENGVSIKEYEPKPQPQQEEKIIKIEDLWKGNNKPELKIETLEQNGYQYVGQTKNGKRHGFGISTTFEKTYDSLGRLKEMTCKRIGQYIDDEPVGMCITFACGTVCFCEKTLKESFEDGGYCLVISNIYYPSGDSIDWTAAWFGAYGKMDTLIRQNLMMNDEPEWPDGLPDLKIKKLKNGIYIGQMESGMMHGYGFVKFDDGNEYIGMFSEDEIWDWGCLKTQNDIYFGYFGLRAVYLDDGMLLQNYGKPNQKVLCESFYGFEFEGEDVSPKGMYIPERCDDDVDDDFVDEDDFDEDIDDPSLDVDDIDDLDDLDDFTDEELDDLVVDDFSDYSDYSKTKDEPDDDDMKASANKIVEDFKQSIFDRYFGKKR